MCWLTPWVKRIPNLIIRFTIPFITADKKTFFPSFHGKRKKTHFRPKNKTSTLENVRHMWRRGIDIENNFFFQKVSTRTREETAELAPAICECRWKFATEIEIEYLSHRQSFPQQLALIVDWLEMIGKPFKLESSRFLLHDIIRNESIKHRWSLSHTINSIRMTQERGEKVCEMRTLSAQMKMKMNPLENPINTLERNRKNCRWHTTNNTCTNL